MEARSLIHLLIFVVVVGVLVWLAIWIINQTVPAQFQMPAKLVVGLIGIIAVLYRLLPMAGM